MPRELTAMNESTHISLSLRYKLRFQIMSKQLFISLRLLSAPGKIERTISHGCIPINQSQRSAKSTLFTTDLEYRTASKVRYET